MQQQAAPLPQEKVKDEAVTILKIKNKFNLADILTKYLSKSEIEQIIDFMQHGHKEGRSEIAPQLSLVVENALNKISNEGIQLQNWCEDM